MITRLPRIEHLDDVKEFIDPTYFLLCQKDGYQVIDYFLSAADTFPAIPQMGGMLWCGGNIEAMEKEWAEWLNATSGVNSVVSSLIWKVKLYVGPWHKFFNLNEKQETLIENIDISQPHMILEKLDGSMIAPFMLNGKVVWGTKMGLTDVAKPVQEYVDKHPEYETFALSMINNLNATPIFEWCSRQQRIVLDYPEERLVLTGLRKIHSGEYYPHNNFAFFAQHNIPVVKVYEGGLDNEFIESMKERQDIEGFVIVFEDGNRLKIKCDWYCQLHQVKAAINKERNVVDMILNHKLDDLKSLLPKEDLTRLNSYELAFHEMMVYNVEYIGNVLDYINSTGMTRKFFALNFSTMNNLEKWVTSTIFKCWDNCGNEAVYKQIKEYILKHCNRNVKFDEMRKNTSLFKNVPEWKQLMFLDEPELPKEND